jgi:hypothetical protein
LRVSFLFSGGVQMASTYDLAKQKIGNTAAGAGRDDGLSGLAAIYKSFGGGTSGFGANDNAMTAARFMLNGGLNATDMARLSGNAQNYRYDPNTGRALGEISGLSNTGALTTPKTTLTTRPQMMAYGDAEQQSRSLLAPQFGKIRSQYEVAGRDQREMAPQLAAAKGKLSGRVGLNPSIGSQQGVITQDEAIKKQEVETQKEAAIASLANDIMTGTNTNNFNQWLQEETLRANQASAEAEARRNATLDQMSAEDSELNRMLKILGYNRDVSNDEWGRSADNPNNQLTAAQIQNYLWNMDPDNPDNMYKLAQIAKAVSGGSGGGRSSGSSSGGYGSMGFTDFTDQILSAAQSGESLESIMQGIYSLTPKSSGLTQSQISQLAKEAEDIWYVTRYGRAGLGTGTEG